MAGAFVAVTGCAPPTTVTRIDGSSAETFARTALMARQEIPMADRLAFDAAIASMPARRYAERDPAQRARVIFDGMTGAEVVATERARTTGRR